MRSADTSACSRDASDAVRKADASVRSSQASVCSPHTSVLNPHVSVYSPFPSDAVRRAEKSDVHHNTSAADVVCDNNANNMDSGGKVREVSAIPTPATLGNRYGTSFIDVNDSNAVNVPTPPQVIASINATRSAPDRRRYKFLQVDWLSPIHGP